MGKYDDIINTKWPVPSTRERMSLSQRAKIFLPFAALKGYEEALEKQRQENIAKFSEKYIKKNEN